MSTSTQTPAAETLWTYPAPCFIPQSNLHIWIFNAEPQAKNIRKVAMQCLNTRCDEVCVGASFSFFCGLRLGLCSGGDGNFGNEFVLPWHVTKSSCMTQWHPYTWQASLLPAFHLDLAMQLQSGSRCQASWVSKQNPSGIARVLAWERGRWRERKVRWHLLFLDSCYHSLTKTLVLFLDCGRRLGSIWFQAAPPCLLFMAKMCRTKKHQAPPQLWSKAPVLKYLQCPGPQWNMATWQPWLQPSQGGFFNGKAGAVRFSPILGTRKSNPGIATGKGTIKMTEGKWSDHLLPSHQGICSPTRGKTLQNWNVGPAIRLTGSKDFIDWAWYQRISKK